MILRTTTIDPPYIEAPPMTTYTLTIERSPAGPVTRITLSKAGEHLATHDSADIEAILRSARRLDDADPYDERLPSDDSIIDAILLTLGLEPQDR